ncbi:aldehyde dehydrogenase [Arenibacter sp. H213]|uniref:Aldehyde dehydrogenase n=1 Tax=Arenibacter antarcticus TaxID=2040469 RepID=A0ABW5VJL7_9FLAO|nr:aldehyde dehydrogenase [Arenibacter sp. H213]MCM4168821.1 aldehyde dehydrogenase [Arenibacter sp. H213]
MDKMQEIVALQKKFFQTNATKEVNFRIAQLKKLESLLRENEDFLHEAIYKDFKKSAFENYTTEISLLYHDIKEAVKKISKWSKKKRVRTNLVNLPAKSYIIPEPLGVSLIIGAWNYPYQLSIAPAIAAIAAGNTVILKPSELPINTSKAMAKLINENFDPNFFRVVEGGVPETTALLNQDFDKIFFTGSVSVGKIVYQAAAKNLIPVTLELGGKSPAIITENCDLKITVKRLIWGKFLNAGQTCIAPDYVVVHKSVKNKFLELAKKEIEESKFLVEEDNYVQIINDANVARLIALIDADKVYTGGKYNTDTRIIEPTILTDVTFEDNVMKDEIFGPILPVIEYEDLDAIIAKIKEMPKPLSCYVFTKDKEYKQKVLNQISFGGGAVNDTVMHISNSNMGFGGVGDSGIGAYHGEYGFKAFSHYKGILDKPTWIEPNLKYYPHTKSKLKWIKRLIG